MVNTSQLTKELCFTDCTYFWFLIISLMQIRTSELPESASGGETGSMVT